MIQECSSQDISALLDDCEIWSRAAAGTARKYFRQNNATSFKDDDSPVTVVDQMIERQLKQAIASKYPGFGIFGEESGIDGGLEGDLWVIDPIDGTRSFISGNPLFGMLLAYVRNGRPKAGVISMPMLDEIYRGGEGLPATCNGAEINVSHKTDLSDAIVYVNEADKLIVQRPLQLQRLLTVGKTRRFGYDCYPHALLAAGHVDAVVDFDLKPYDFLALSSVVRSAGGIMTDWQGHDLSVSSGGGVVSSASPEIHAQLLDILRDDKL